MHDCQLLEKAPPAVAAPVDAQGARVRQPKSCKATQAQAGKAVTVACKVTHLQLHNVPQLPDLRLILLRKCCGPACITAQPN